MPKSQRTTDTNNSAPVPEQGGTSGKVQSLERAITLLQATADSSPDGDTASNLAAQCGLNRATAWRLLSTLEQFGLVERSPVTNRYTIGFAVARMASAAGFDGLIRRAHGTLRRVSEQTGETANLAVVQQLGLTYIAEVTPPVVLSAKWLGRQVPLHATSTGKALLAWIPEEEAQSLLSGPLDAYTDTTITDRARLRTELEQSRERGYSVCVGEMERNLYGVSAPVLGSRGRPFAVVSIWGPQDRVPESRFAALGPLARAAADEIAKAAQAR
ncbi:transcriptional regulator [Streptomyces viridochromogenes DSM 40736]|uniref:Transcriptional regulator n=1 Tax=Streptomyces viridochromogenes (strain DSM 40736 / JCM 4977 / BCRC 1201 / Tue 494) TaxID=591159 RepID=D9X380_STRVT|nr:IclR family transcriptional regulator [Streptomyces viridochromogenes]EFL29596.1 transcriptional regulator [Streptomyces viridochromogenes DSM 40736]